MPHMSNTIVPTLPATHQSTFVSSSAATTTSSANTSNVLSSFYNAVNINLIKRILESKFIFTFFQEQQSTYTVPNTGYTPTMDQNQTAISFAPPMHTYSTYAPQVQGTVTTPISLPGMPPITVSANIPSSTLEGIQFNTQQSN